MITLSPRMHEVKVNGRTVELTHKEFFSAKLLIENKGVPVSRELLMERVWGINIPHDTWDSRSIDQAICRLRKKLKVPFVKTVNQVGYRCIAGKII